MSINLETQHVAKNLKLAGRIEHYAKLKELERIRKYISEKNNKNFSQPFSIHSLEEWLRLEWFKNINEKKIALL